MLTFLFRKAFRTYRHEQRRSRSRLRRPLELEILETRTLLSTQFQPNYIIFHTGSGAPSGSSSPLASAFTPAGIEQAYAINNAVIGDGTGETIAIIDAYDDPSFVSRSPTLPIAQDTNFLASDLHKFDVQYNLPEPVGFFTKVNQSGGTAYPPTDPAGAGNNNWESEEALDVEWVHSLAPGAHILLVEANDNSNNLFTAVSWAATQSGAQVVSMSWGGGEFNGENTYDSSYFVSPASHGVTFLASTGDLGAPGEYPAYSPNIVAVGGTTLHVSGGNYSSEVGWSGSGGGISQYESQPAYQVGLTPSSTQRTIPDIAFDADPSTGVSVYDSYNGNVSGGPWYQFGGTSVACPCWAALVGIADEIRANAGLGSLNGFSQTLPTLYTLPASDFHDVTTGNNGFAAGTGYDLVTGIGTPIASLLVPGLAGLRVIASTPANGSTVATPPTVFTTTLSQAIIPSNLPANSLQVNGIAATSVTLSGAGTIAIFTYSSSPVTAQGAQSMTLNAAILTGAFNATFYYDVLTLAVTSTNPLVGGTATVSSGSFTYAVTFDEPIDPATAGTSNLTLSQGTVSGVTVLAGNQTVQYTVSGLTTDGQLFVTLPAGKVMDAFDNPGFTPFTGTYLLHSGAVPLPTPLGGSLPPGSLVYGNGGVAGPGIGFAGDTNSLTINVAAGQTITVLAVPSDTLQATLQLLDPTNTVLGSVTAGGPGKKALLQTIPSTSVGVYTIAIAGANGTLGGYTVQVTLNAALETENTDGPSDDTLATAQSIDGSFLSLGSAGTRGAVIGQTDLVGSSLPTEIEPNNTLATADSAIGNFASYSGNLYHLGITGTISGGNTEYFSIGTLQVGDTITISDSGASSSRGTLPDPFVELYRSNGGSPVRVTFDDDSGPGLDSLIYRFAITTLDTYYVRAMGFGNSSGTYSLGIEVEDNAAPLATGGTFTTATGTNTSFATANDASTSWRPVQYLSATTGTMITRGDTDFYQYTFTAGDLVSVTINSTSTLNARVNLLSASGAVIASEDGTSIGPGTSSPLYAVLIPATGTYYVQVLGASGTGTYTDNVYLSTTTPPPHASPSGADYYAFTLAAGDTASLAVKALSSGSVNLTLQNVSGTTLATGVSGPTNVNQIITDFTAPSAGTYYALVTGTAGTNYSLVVTRNAEFDTKPNSSIATAQPMNSRQVAGSQSALGGLTSGDANFYAITLAANGVVQIATATPGYGSAAPANALDPLIRLFNASDTQVASASNNAGDGHNAVISYTVPAGQGGTYYVEILPISPTTGDYILTLTGTSDPGAQRSASSTGLYVTSLTPTPSGFIASFSAPFVNSSSSPIHLYDAASAGYGPADVTLVGQTTGAVQGSLLIDPSNSSFTFVKTGGVLAPDTYTVTFVSGAIAFRDATGAPLNGDGANPGNYVTTFTVADSGAIVVSVPDFARGPDSADVINVPNNSTNGIPITLSNGSGVTDAVFVLQYDADLLTISGGSVNANLAGASFTVTTSGSGSSAQATIVFHSPTPLGSGAVQLGGLTATVPSAAGYASEELLHFSSVSLNNGAIAAVGADGIHVVAYLGDTSGDGTYTSQDSVLLANVASGADSGFAAYPTVDPVIIGDISGTGAITAADVALLNRYLSGTAVAQVPNYPAVAPPGAATPALAPAAAGSGGAVAAAAGTSGFQADVALSAVDAPTNAPLGVPAALLPGQPRAGSPIAAVDSAELHLVDQVFLERGMDQPADWLPGNRWLEEDLARALVAREASAAVPDGLEALPWDGGDVKPA